MYEQFKHLIMAELSKDFNVDQLRKISECLDLATKNFDVVKKETQIVPYGQEIPKAVESVWGIGSHTLFILFFYRKCDTKHNKNQKIGSTSSQTVEVVKLC